MVKVSIIVEGGVIDTNVSAGTIDNSNALRESLYWIFSGPFPKRPRIIPFPWIRQKRKDVRS